MLDSTHERTVFHSADGRFEGSSHDQGCGDRTGPWCGRPASWLKSSCTMDVTFPDRQNCSMKFGSWLTTGPWWPRPHRRTWPEGLLRQRRVGDLNAKGTAGPQARRLLVPVHQLLLRAAAPAPVLHAFSSSRVWGCPSWPCWSSTCSSDEVEALIHLCPGFPHGPLSCDWGRSSLSSSKVIPLHREYLLFIMVFCHPLHHRHCVCHQRPPQIFLNLPPHGPLG